MYREPHLQNKSDECAELWHRWKELFDKNPSSKEAKDARKKWCNCVTEFGKMVSEEVKTNTRYHGIRK